MKIVTQVQFWSGFRRVLIAGIEGEQIVSSCWLVLYNGGQSYLSALYTLPEFRKRGLASLVIDYAENLARQEGKSYIELNYRRGSADVFVLKMYKTWGYEERDFYGSRITLRKNLIV